MTRNPAGQWAPDPTGRHESRWWDGAGWTANVQDGSVPGHDPLDAPPAARSSAAGTPKPLLPWWGHVLLGLATCGLWLVAAPAVHWLRRGAVKPALIWSGVWAVLIAAAALNGGSDDPVATVAATASITTTVGTTTTTTTSPAAPATGSPPAPTTAAAPPPRPRALVAPAVTSAAPTTGAGRRSTTTARRTTTRAKRSTTTTRTVKARRTTTEPPSGGGGTDPDYGTCAEAIDAGKGPYYEGRDVEYGWYRDADHDGIVCER